MLPVPWVCPVLLVCLCLAVSSCQTVQGMGRDLGNAGKAIFGPKDKAKADAAALQQAPVSKPNTTPAVITSVAPVAAKPLVKKEEKEKGQGSGFLGSVWDSITKPIVSFIQPPERPEKPKPAKKSLDDLGPITLKEGMFTKTESSKRASQEPEAVTLEKFSEESDVEEVPDSTSSWEGATAVDVNGDGIPDARYRQR